MKYILTILLAVFSISIQAQDYKLEGSEVKITKQVEFEPGTAKLKSESTAALQIIKQYLDDKSYISLLRVEAHTYIGDFDTNQILSEKRALVVCKKLIDLGVDCKRLIAVGFGNTKPLFDSGTAAESSGNERISFFNVSLRGRVIGSMPIDGGGKFAGELCN